MTSGRVLVQDPKVIVHNVAVFPLLEYLIYARLIRASAPDRTPFIPTGA